LGLSFQKEGGVHEKGLGQEKEGAAEQEEFPEGHGARG